MDYDAIILWSGSNGWNGLRVLLVEAKDTIGGGIRSKALTLPGFLHEICSSIHPMAAASPFFRGLPLTSHGLVFIFLPLRRDNVLVNRTH